MKVIVATDCAELSRSTIQSIAERPWKKDDSFIVLMVAGDHQPIHEAYRLTTREATALSDSLPGNPVETVVLHGAIADTICGYARQCEADLIFLGTHGRTGLQHFLFGSIAEQVLKKSSCSVGIIKEKREEETEDESPTVSNYPRTELASFRG